MGPAGSGQLAWQRKRPGHWGRSRGLGKLGSHRDWGEHSSSLCTGGEEGQGPGALRRAPHCSGAGMPLRREAAVMWRLRAEMEPGACAGPQEGALRYGSGGAGVEAGRSGKVKRERTRFPLHLLHRKGSCGVAEIRDAARLESCVPQVCMLSLSTGALGRLRCGKRPVFTSKAGRHELGPFTLHLFAAWGHSGQASLLLHHCRTQ